MRKHGLLELSGSFGIVGTVYLPLELRRGRLSVEDLLWHLLDLLR